jgi:hypothetical protein
MLKAELQGVNYDNQGDLEIEINRDEFPELIDWRGMTFLFRKEDWGRQMGIYTKVKSSGVVNFYPNEKGPLWTV